MKFQKFFLAIIFGLFLTSFVSSVDIEIKDSVKLGENFIVKISGVFLNSIQENQVKFYRQGYMPTEMGSIDIKEIEGDYYFYLEIPLEKTSENYTIVIEDVKYKSGRDTIEGDISASFTITEQMAPFSISPPLIIATGEYEVEVQNLLDKSITIDLERKVKPTEPVEEDNSTNETSENDEGFFDIFFNLFSSDNSTEETNSTPITGQAVTDAPITLKSGEIKTLTFLAPKEKGFEKLELYYDYEGYAALVYNPEGEKIVIIDDDEEEKEIINQSENETNQTINETIEFNETQEEVNHTNIEVKDDGTIINKTSNETIGSTQRTCSQNNGVICKKNAEVCLNNEKVKSSNGYCCLSECIEVKKTSTGKIIGWIIIGALALFLAWFFKQKYSRAGPGAVNLLAIANGRK
jgi:hypothetical protein